MLKEVLIELLILWWLQCLAALLSQPAGSGHRQGRPVRGADTDLRPAPPEAIFLKKRILKKYRVPIKKYFVGQKILCFLCTLTHFTSISIDLGV